MEIKHRVTTTDLQQLTSARAWLALITSMLVLLQNARFHLRKFYAYPPDIVIWCMKSVQHIQIEI